MPQWRSFYFFRINCIDLVESAEVKQIRQFWSVDNTLYPLYSVPRYMIQWIKFTVAQSEQWCFYFSWKYFIISQICCQKIQKSGEKFCLIIFVAVFRFFFYENCETQMTFRLCFTWTQLVSSLKHWTCFLDNPKKIYPLEWNHNFSDSTDKIEIPTWSGSRWKHLFDRVSKSSYFQPPIFK